LNLQQLHTPLLILTEVVTKIANPDKTGVNTSATVAKMVKAQDQYMQEVRSKWHLQLTFQLKLFKVKVWSPVAGKNFVKV
jgi:hypothetical protein